MVCILTSSVWVCSVVDFLFIVTPIVEVCDCSMFCCTLLYVHSSIAVILMGKRELIALLNLSSWCLVMVERLFLAVPQGCLQFVIVVFPDHTHLLFLWFQQTPNTLIDLCLNHCKHITRPIKVLDKVSLLVIRNSFSKCGVYEIFKV